MGMGGGVTPKKLFSILLIALKSRRRVLQLLNLNLLNMGQSPEFART